MGLLLTTLSNLTGTQAAAGPAPRVSDYRGPAFLSYGFRPFFLLGALYAGAIVLVWLPMFYGDISAATVWLPRDWHIHELLFGYVPAVVTGFLLTAIPNWSGRLPLQGRPLLTLVAVWIAGRVAVTLSSAIGWAPTAVIDSAFLVLVALAAVREIVAGKNWRNLKVVAVVSLLALCNIAFHVEAHLNGVTDYAPRAGIAVTIMLIILIGGRIVPSFTHTWLARQKPGRLPVPFSRFDMACVLASLTALAIWVVAPLSAVAGAVLVIGAAFNFVRFGRWAGDRTVGERLVLILHVGYFFVPLGFALAALAAFGLVLPDSGIHAWTVGAIGCMTLAVMTRASLGHTGRPLTATPRIQLVYAAIVVAALARLCAGIHVEWSFALLHVAAGAWALAFFGFAVVYAPWLLRARRAAVTAD
jgi:uncharacterized protein involved in response to NO